MTVAARTPFCVYCSQLSIRRPATKEIAPMPIRRFQFHCLKRPLELKQVPGTGVGDLSRRSHTESLTQYLLIILVLECSLAVLVVVLVESELDSEEVSNLEIEGTYGDAIFFEFDNIDSRK